MKTDLSDEQKKEMYEDVREYLADELEIDVNEITDDTNLIDDLGADSIIFLEMFEEFKEKYGIDVEVRTIGRYMLKNPVYTFGETIEAMFAFIERGEELIEELRKEEDLIEQKN